ncbi:phosphoenolpyruvate phosphomutase [Talaromyces proteolyticus]|uniref:Phosphoenolpyruvate phosphomutase n=1 Tax=Talaromyces proteolyticus TaxID=1131652 RepID=A0AAD4KWU4_9EURO|nr:phosphoenolpyruvate phosphomutase [Talaromyces proteolyticus]KAH8700938.1 phosphoenolpyruvate phosphomutase [Talaromyces proteolyticus]
MAVQTGADILRKLLDKSKPAIAMAAHNPLSATIAAEAGFDSVWISGFELSASYAVPDASIIPMGTHLEMTRCIAESTSNRKFPVIADIDTGFGNAINVAYSIPRYEAAGAAAVVIEDKKFPKDSSLRLNGRQELVSIEEFQGKIAAAKAKTHLMLIIARTEALIAGLGEEEALRRALSYAEAGADAILIHSKKSTPEEILSFCRAWPDEQVPLVLVPTSYTQLSFADIAALKKVGLIICGNHAIRACVASMRKVFGRILKDGSIAYVNEDIASVSDVFEIQGDAALRALEKEYLR